MRSENSIQNLTILNYLDAFLLVLDTTHTKVSKFMSNVELNTTPDSFTQQIYDLFCDSLDCVKHSSTDVEVLREYDLTIEEVDGVKLDRFFVNRITTKITDVNHPEGLNGIIGFCLFQVAFKAILVDRNLESTIKNELLTSLADWARFKRYVIPKVGPFLQDVKNSAKDKRIEIVRVINEMDRIQNQLTLAVVKILNDSCMTRCILDNLRNEINREYTELQNLFISENVEDKAKVVSDLFKQVIIETD